MGITRRKKAFGVSDQTFLFGEKTLGMTIVPKEM
jgi:hypothetical protein